MFKRTVVATSVAAAILLASTAVDAAGMGKITVLSALGQPLRAELDVTATREETASLAARVAPVDAFRQANLDYAGVLSGMRFTLDKRPDGKPYFKIKTDRPVNDPFIDLLVELSWSSGRLVREYAFLLDPSEPKNSAASSAVVAPPVVVQPAPEATPAASPPASVQEIVKPVPEPDAPVTTKKIEKAPVFSPVSKKPAAAESSPSSDGEAGRKVKAGDTLSKIAGENIVEGITLNQMLVALFNNNRDAFVGGNMNRLRAGKILAIPDAEAVAKVGDAEARKVVTAQSADFNAYRNALAGAASEQPGVTEQAPQSSSGKIAPKVEEPAASDSGKDKLQVSRSDADAKAIAAGKVTEEDRIARDKALKEANSRIADLQKNLGDLKVLAELKSKGTADAQKSMPSVASDAPLPVAPLQVEAAPPAIGAEVAAVSGVAVEPAVSATTALPVAEDMPKPKKVVAPSPLVAPSFIEENPLLVYGGGAAIAALLGFLGFRGWKRKRDADIDNFTVTGMATGPVFDAAASDGADSGLGQSVASDFGHSTLDALDSAKAGVDPIQEAEVYMAYGRDVQAEEILREALGKDPSNLVVAVKLLEIYAGRKSLPQFNELASDLHGRTSEDSPEWLKAVELGSTLDSSNPLYGAIELPSDVLADNLTGSSISTASPEPVSLPPEEVVLPPVVDEASSVLDFDLDLPASTDQASAVPVASGLDFDLDLGSNEKTMTGAPSVGGLDIDLDSPGGADNSIDFDLGEVAATGSAPPLDLSSISLELDPPKTFAVIADSPDAASKLELAHAYEEMGDHEGARELLQEVIAEGSPAQQESARNKLAQLK